MADKAIHVFGFNLFYFILCVSGVGPVFGPRKLVKFESLADFFFHIISE